jgi:hypothetical protein
MNGVSNLSGNALVSRYEKLISCDKNLAKDAFPQFMRASGDDVTLVELSLVAIEFNAWTPVWGMLGQITDYDTRDVVATGLGRSCAENDKVVGFLQGAYFALKPIDFQQWDGAYLVCEADTFGKWFQKQVENPPAKLFDDKWNALVEAYVRKNGAAALPSLTLSGKQASENGGPFEVVLTQMEAAVAPSLGEEMSAEDASALHGSLIELARGVRSDSARRVADRLANLGADPEAAALLRSIFPDRIVDGKLVYASASVEAGTCGGARTVMIHATQLVNPLSIWDVTAAAQERLRAFKPRLGKCNVDTPWPVIVSVEPLRPDEKLDAFLMDLKEIWKQKGYAVKVRNEKTVEL